MISTNVVIILAQCRLFSGGAGGGLRWSWWEDSPVTQRGRQGDHQQCEEVRQGWQCHKIRGGDNVKHGRKVNSGKRLEGQYCVYVARFLVCQTLIWNRGPPWVSVKRFRRNKIRCLTSHYNNNKILIIIINNIKITRQQTECANSVQCIQDTHTLYTVHSKVYSNINNMHIHTYI